MWLTIGKFLLGPVGTILAGVAAAGLLVLWLNTRADLHAANVQVQQLNDSIHGGEPGYKVTTPGYVIRMGAMQSALNTETANRSNLQTAINKQNADIAMWKAEADKRLAAFNKEHSLRLAKTREAQLLSDRIAAIKPVPGNNMSDFAQRTIQAFVGGLP